ncbi:MAG: hypothetical protein IT372_06435 [Polyangiaceae bacterium]|nr:hypothetical protein [Polyangiaceae bacterium]
MQPGDLCAGRFELTRLLRASAGAASWSAVDREGGAPVALWLAGGGADDEAWLARQAAIAAIEHPALARRVAHGVTAEGLRFVAAEAPGGEILAARLARGSLTLNEALALSARAAEALSAAHARGIVHGGVAPALFALPGGDAAQAKLHGLGVGEARGAALAPAEGLAPGGAAYLAPELAQGEVGADARTDIFALGCVMYECLAGMAPFTGTTALAALAKVLLASPPPVRRLCEEVPEPIAALVGRMLSKSPEARPTGCAEVLGIAHDVARRRAGGGEHARMEAPGPGLAEERSDAELLGAPSTKSRHIWLLVALAPERAAGDADARIAEIAQDFHASAHRLVDGAIFIRIDPERSAPTFGDPPSSPGEAPFELRRNAVLLNRLRRARIQALGGERAARCALGVRAALGGGAMVLTMTPRARPSEWLSSQSIEWATKLLESSMKAGLQGIGMDKESADLLRGELFNVVGSGHLVELRGEWAHQGG